MVHLLNCYCLQGNASCSHSSPKRSKESDPHRTSLLRVYLWSKTSQCKVNKVNGVKDVIIWGWFATGCFALFLDSASGQKSELFNVLLLASYIFFGYWWWARIFLNYIISYKYNFSFVNWQVYLVVFNTKSFFFLSYCEEKSQSNFSTQLNNIKLQIHRLIFPCTNIFALYVKYWVNIWIAYRYCHLCYR